MSRHASYLWYLFAGAGAIVSATGCQHARQSQPESEPAPVVSPAGAIPISEQLDTVSAQDVVSEGRRIFHGPGLCYACHGGRLQGGPVAPPLAGPHRNPADTSFAHILHVVRAGEPHTPMVASQGGIDAGQMVQVANYVWAVSNGKSVP